MLINEKKLLDYLYMHTGENTRIFNLVKNSEACEGMSDEKITEELMKINYEVRKIAQDNGFRLNSDHHSNVESGMPWVYDFYIEIADVEKDIARIDSAFQLKIKTALIINEYGIYDEEKDLLIGFRTSIPWQIKKIYDELTDEIESLESDERLID